MDICTIIEFREALITPYNYFESLHNIHPDLSTLCRSRHFAECRAIVNGRNAIIYAPISPMAMELALTAQRTLSGIQSRVISPIEIHGAELRCGMLCERRCAIIVEYPFLGIPLHEAMYTTSHDRLMRGLEQLFERLAECDISHNNLSEHNIIIDNIGEWHITRQYYVSPKYGNDATSHQRLCELIERHALADGEALELLHEEYASYCAQAHVIEHRQRITRNNLIGFADTEGNCVIECKYTAASDFAEGRSVVADEAHRMGLIDHDGNEIIPTLYDEVDYDSITGCSIVYHEGRCAKFDYHGSRLGEWIDEAETCRR